VCSLGDRRGGGGGPAQGEIQARHARRQPAAKVSRCEWSTKMGLVEEGGGLLAPVWTLTPVMGVCPIRPCLPVHHEGGGAVVLHNRQPLRHCHQQLPPGGNSPQPSHSPHPTTLCATRHRAPVGRSQGFHLPSVYACVCLRTTGHDGVTQSEPPLQLFAPPGAARRFGGLIT
jgi:hypothetical protein